MWGMWMAETKPPGVRRGSGRRNQQKLFASLYSLIPSAPRLMVTKPVIPSCTRAFLSASRHFDPAFINFALTFLFFDTTLLALFNFRFALVRPPLVNFFVPFHTWR